MVFASLTFHSLLLFFVVNRDLFLGFQCSFTSFFSLALFFVTSFLIYTFAWLVPVTWPTNLSYVVSFE